MIIKYMYRHNFIHYNIINYILIIYYIILKLSEKYLAFIKDTEILCIDKQKQI